MAISVCRSRGSRDGREVSSLQAATASLATWAETVLMLEGASDQRERLTRHARPASHAGSLEPERTGGKRPISFRVMAEACSQYLCTTDSLLTPISWKTWTRPGEPACEASSPQR